MTEKAATETVVGTHPPKPSTAVVRQRKPRKTPVPTTQRKTTALVAPDVGGMEGLLALALREKAPVEALERLVALKERMTAQVAVKEYITALSDFQAHCPAVRKTKPGATVTERGGAKVAYYYAPLAEILQVVGPELFKRGFTFTWDQVMADGKMEVTCYLRHAGGHVERSQFTCAVGAGAPLMSEPQKYESAYTLAQRVTFRAVTGLVTLDPNFTSEAQEADQAKITPDQLVALEDLLESAKTRSKKPETVLGRFQKYMGIDRLADIRAIDYSKAAAALTSPAAT